MGARSYCRRAAAQIRQGVATDTDTAQEASEPSQQPQIQGGIKTKNLIIIGLITAAVWAFTLQTGSTVLLVITSILTVVMLAVLIYAFRTLRKQKGLVGILQGATTSPEARREAIAKLAAETIRRPRSR
jgi:hypothetical protein